MKQFFAALAMVSALLVAENARACERPELKEAVELRLNFLKAKPMTMSGARARAYLATINAEPPETNLIAETIIIAVGSDRVSVAPVVDGFVCTGDYLVYAPDLHKRALNAADRSSI